MPERRKLVVVGDGMCGKTSLLMAYSRDGQFTDDYVPTIFETSVAPVQVTLTSFLWFQI